MNQYELDQLYLLLMDKWEHGDHEGYIKLLEEIKEAEKHEN